MSGAEVILAESKLNSMDDNDENKEEEIDPSSIIYCNDFSITDDEVDSDGSYDNIMTKEETKSLVECHEKMPGSSSKRPENFTNKGMSKTKKEKVKIHPCSSSAADFSKRPVNLMKEKSLEDPPNLYYMASVQREHSSPDGLDRELPSEVRSIPSQPGNNYSSRNKNVAYSKMTDSIKGTPDSHNPNSLNRKTLPKSAKSDKSKEGSSNQLWYFDLGKVTENAAKKTKEKRKTKGAKYRQLLRKRYSGISRKYGKTYLSQQKLSTPISMLKSYADKAKVDFVKLMENIDLMGLDLPFPCNECYFKKKTVDIYSNSFDMLTNTNEKQGAPMDKKCPDCGAERITLESYGKMIANLRRMIEYRNLLVHDVFPDGNCMYAAIVDQLRIRGDFSWTYTTLRTCAVEYLRENPLEEDGTHKQMYLDRETWEEYLERNSEDGEWGDHIMMSAIVEVLQRKIVILGGVSGKARNIIVPKSMCSVHTSKEVGEPTSNQPMETKVENKKEELEEEVEKKKKKETRDEIRYEDKMEGLKQKEEDKETKKRRMREEAIQRKEKEDDELEDETCLYLGHLSESHYISLRKRGWANISQEKMIEETQGKKQQLKKENPDLFLMGDEIDYSKDVADKNEIDPLSKEPILHLDFTVKQMLEGYFEMSPMVVQTSDNDMQTFEFLSSKCENMYPVLFGGKTLMSRYATEELLFCFPNSCEMKEVKKNILVEDMLLYCIPRDTRVHEKDFQDVAKVSDLIEEPVRNMCGELYLIPKKSRLWKDYRTENKDGKICLQHIPLKPSSVSLTGYSSEVSYLPVRQIIAFKCQWPAEAAEWVSRERPVNWPPAKVVEEIINRGCHVIPVEHGEPIQGMDIDDITWEYSFFVAEKSLLLSSISKHQRTCFFIFRLLVEKQLHISQSVLYQVLKNIFLFACEIFDEKMWSKRPGFCILHMLSRLVFCLDKGEAPMYFMSRKNLIRYVPRETTLTQAQQLEVLRLNPIISIYWLLDEYNLTSSDVGVTFDDVIADLGRFAEHHDFKQSMTDIILPASIETARDHIESAEYSAAFKIIMDIYEELNDHDQSKEDSSIADFIKNNFSDLFIGYLWCLALYVDLNAGTNLVPDICLEYQCVSVSYLFGPEIIEYLGYKPVPNIFAGSWDLKFAKEVVIVLRSVHKYKEITVGLRYFLDTLEDLVTEKSLTESYYSHSSLFTKVNLYIELYNAYYKCNEVSEFADLLERFEKLVFKLDIMEAYLHLSEMSNKLGKIDLMTKAAKKAAEKYESGNYVVCNCEECRFTLSSSDLAYDDDLLFNEVPPPKGVANKNKPVTSSDENKGTARSRPHGRDNMENPLRSNEESDLEEPPIDVISSLALLLGNMRPRSSAPAGRSRGPSLFSFLLPPYDSSGGSSGNNV